MSWTEERDVEARKAALKNWWRWDRLTRVFNWGADWANRKAYDRNKEALEWQQDRVLKQDLRIQQLTEALQFYANPKLYQEVDGKVPVMQDRGSRSRSAIYHTVHGKLELVKDPTVWVPS